MNRRRVKIAIIGAGSAGMAAHAMASRRSDDLLLIEVGDYGTTCARSGCMPSKLLIAAAEARHAISHAAQFGIHATGVQVDGDAVMQRLRALRDHFVASVLGIVERIPPAQRMQGRARFVAPYTLDVDGTTVEADRIVIATGSRPRIMAPWSTLGARLLTSDTVFDLPTLPRSLAVIGGGAIGLELGQSLHRLGVRVQLFARDDRLGPRGDTELATEATALFSASLPCVLGTEPRLLGVDAEGVELGWNEGGTDRHERFDHVLLAAGRVANVDELQLAASGLACDARGIPLFDRTTMRCGDSRVFIAGDVDGRHALLHVATEDGRIAGDNAARYPEFRTHRRQVALAIGFTDPQYAVIGRQLDGPGGEQLAIGSVSFARQGRSQVVGRNHGMARLYGDPATGKLVGAQLLGPQVEHLAHLLAWSIQSEATVDALLAMPFYHPVIEEGLRTALGDLRHAMHRGAAARRDCLECGPGS